MERIDTKEKWLNMYSLLKEEIKKLVTSCSSTKITFPCHNHGCSFSSSAEHLLTHKLECEYRFVYCTYKDICGGACQEPIQFHQLEKHNTDYSHCHRYYTFLAHDVEISQMFSEQDNAPLIETKKRQHDFI